MADALLRQLDRAASGGDVQARARLLGERVRRGELSERRLIVAALGGDRAGQLAAGRESAADADLVNAVGPVDPEASVRAAIVAAVHVAPLLRTAIATELRTARMYTWNRERCCQRALQLLQAWADAPDSVQAEPLTRARDATAATNERCVTYLQLTEGSEGGHGEAAGRVTALATEALCGLLEGRPQVAHTAGASAVRHAAQAVDQLALLTEIRHTLVAWALGPAG